MNGKIYRIRNGGYRYFNADIQRWVTKDIATEYTLEQKNNVVLEPNTHWVSDRPRGKWPSKKRVWCHFEITHKGELFGYFSSFSYPEISNTLKEALRFYKQPARAFRGIDINTHISSWIRQGMEGVIFNIKDLRVRGLSKQEFDDLTRKEEA